MLQYWGVPGDRIQGPVGLGAETLHGERQTDVVEEQGLLEGAGFGPGHRK